MALLKKIWEPPNLTFMGSEPMISVLDLPMLYQLSYEASMGAGCGNDIDIVWELRSTHEKEIAFW